MAIELDQTPVNVSELAQRQGITRQAMYLRIKSLNELGWEIKPFKQGDDGQKTFIHHYQALILDQLDDYLKIAGNKIKDFVPEKQEQAQEYPTMPEHQLEKIPATIPMNEEFYLKIIATIIQQAQVNQKNPDEKYIRLELYVEKQWLATNQEFAAILGIKRLPRSPYYHSGFVFVKYGKFWQVNRYKYS